MSSVIKAVGVTKLGAADLLQNVTIQKPQLNARDLLVKVRAVSVNPVDFKKRIYGLGQKNPITEENPLVLGFDAVGEVVEVGSHVQFFKVGDQVYYAGDITKNGSNSQYQAIDERIVGLKPNTLTDGEAVAIPLVALTAWESIFEHMRVSLNPHENQGKTILITAGAGGVGSFAVQLAKWAGLTVIATASRQDSIEYSKKNGADIVINHYNNLQEQLAQHGIKEVNYILHTVDMTEAYFNQFAEIIAPFGKINGITGFQEGIQLAKIFFKRVEISIELMFTRSFYGVEVEKQHEILNNVAKLLDEKKLVSTKNYEEKFTVENLKKAHESVESGKNIGKFVLTDVDKYFQQ